MKEVCTAQELASALSVTERAIQIRAKREAWPALPRSGRGGGRAYPLANLPRDIQDKIFVMHMEAAKPLEPSPLLSIPTEPAPPAPLYGDGQPALLKDWQRETRDARLAILAEIKSMSRTVGMLAAERRFAELVRTGGLPQKLRVLVAKAHARQGERRALSTSTLRGWRRALAQHGPDGLAPRPTQSRRWLIPDWLPDFLGLYRRPTKPSMGWCYEELEKTGVELPSLRTVQREVQSLGALVVNTGRMLPREIKRLKAYTRKSFEGLLPTDVYTADGHCMDLEVLHPLHGQPFRPEVISVLDVATRRCVGFSLGLAESAWLVADALRVAVEFGGIPAIFYVDNGPGFVNEHLDGPAVGLMARLGTTKEHSLPYNSQARGVIERFQKTCWIRAAKELDAFMGADMDREARQAVFKQSRSEIKHQGGTNLLLAWPEYVKWVCRTVDAYNSRPHSTLPKIVDPATGRKRHQTPMERWKELAPRAEIIMPDEAERLDLFRPNVERTVKRYEVKLMSKVYYSRDLELHHGETVQVAYDIHDPSRVWVRDGEGRYLCQAQLGGNEKPYFPLSAVEEARERRATARLKRLETHSDEVRAELAGGRPALPEPVPLTPEQQALHEAIVAELAPSSAAIPAAPDQSGGRVLAFPKDRPAPERPETPQDRFSRAKRLEALVAGGVELTTTDELWLGGYQHTPEYKSYVKMLQDFTPEALGLRLHD
jgi:putative transposase